MAAFCLEVNISKCNSTDQSPEVNILVTPHIVNLGSDEYGRTPHRKGHKDPITGVIIRLIFGAVDLGVMLVMIT